jgi:hypothetical protein
MSCVLVFSTLKRANLSHELTFIVAPFNDEGNSHTIVLNGQGGEDYFDIVRNTQLLDLNGDSGNDVFVIRSFLALRIIEGVIQDSDTGDVKAHGGKDNDFFEIGDTVTSYVVNAGVDVDGGTGTYIPADSAIVPCLPL